MKLDDYIEDLQRCAYCPKMCRFACPVSGASKKETHIPQQKMALLDYYRLGKLEASEKLLETLFHCTGCLLCHTYCHHENRVPEALTAGRALLREEGVVSEKVAELESKAAEAEMTLKATVRQSLHSQFLSDESQAIYIPDRITIKHFPHYLKKVFQIFSALGLDYIAMREDYGYAGDIFYYETGNRERYDQWIESNLPKLAGYKTIVTDSPSLLYSLKTHYAAKEPEIANRAVWMADLLLENLTEESVQRKVPLKRYLYHDSSYAGRYLGRYETPRKLLSLICEAPPSDFQHNRDAADSTGGFVWPILFPELADEIALRRWEEIDEHALDTPSVVVAGVDALRNLQRIESNADRVTHLTDLIHQAVC